MLAESKSRSYNLVQMQGIDVVHTIATLTIAFLFIRGIQLLTEHYFPNSGAAQAEAFLYGKP